jgi:pimeloyl-ACP methyl ester carboxylesterase
MGPSIFYLHGFASSAKSTKAAYLGERFRQYGLTLRCPDFNQPDFATLTMTRMLDQLDREMAAAGTAATRPATLIGSSLGGTLAILAAAAFGARVDRLVLLAPAVVMFANVKSVVGSGFSRIGPPEDGPHGLLAPDRIADWRRLGRLPFFHYADNVERMLDFTFYEDSFRYNPFDAAFPQPALIFQGTRDLSVDPRTVEAFARVRPNVTLSLLEDDHSLTSSLPRIWEDVSAFLEVE